MLMMETIRIRETYIAPQIEVVEVVIEQGYAMSMEEPGKGGTHDWKTPMW
jgi:hypothetical protein